MPGRTWFSRKLLPWYHEHRRALPWRGIRDPYGIWLSEVILQQTRVDQGLAYYERFIQHYPKVQDLAAAKEDDVLKLWQGLGYYSRARNLLTAARQVLVEHGGRFPDRHPDLLKLKGVGDYTASAIASIAFDRPEAVVDGNVYRVLARVFGMDTPIDSTEGRKEFKALAQELIDPKHPGDHNQAVMELGATICTPRNYACMRCPLQAKCIAFATSRMDELPVKQGKTKTRDRFFNYLHIRSGQGIYLGRRKGKDIWEGLFELPLIESGQRMTKSGLFRELERTGPKGWRIVAKSSEVRHVLSHQIIHALFWEIEPPNDFKASREWRLVPLKKLHEFAVPRLIERWMETHKLGTRKPTRTS